MEPQVAELKQKIEDTLCPFGFEVYPFQVGLSLLWCQGEVYGWLRCHRREALESSELPRALLAPCSFDVSGKGLNGRLV